MLLCYNKTGADVPLAAGNPIRNIPASLSPPERGDSFNVTTELQPNLTVDPAQGVVGGLDAAAYALLQAQSASLDFEWTADPEYLTPGLTVSGPAPGLHGPTHDDGGSDPAAKNGIDSLATLRRLGFAATMAAPGDSVLSASKANAEYYANSVTGLDTNDGLTPGTAKQTWPGIKALLADNVRHHANLNLEGIFNVAWNDNFFRWMNTDKMIKIDGGAGLTQIFDPGVAADISSPTSIGNSGLTMTPNEHFGKKIRILTGAAAGEIRTCSGNDATTFFPVVDEPFSVDPGAGATWDIVVSSTEFNVTGTPYDLVQHINGGLWSFLGEGNIHLQRLHFTGNIPINVAGIGGAKPGFTMASCTIDKPQTAGNIWRISPIFIGTNIALNSTVYDMGAPGSPVYGAGATLPLDKAGVGEMGGDGSMLFYGVLDEWCVGFNDIVGCAFEMVLINSSPGAGVRISQSRIKNLFVINTALDQVADMNNTKFGGFVPFGFGSPVLPGALLIDSMVTFEDCDFSNSVHGIYGRGAGKARIEGTITGNNALSGAFGNDGFRIYPEPGSTITLTGAVIGDFTLDGAVPYPGGWAAVLAGTRAIDPNTGAQCRAQARLGY